MAIRSIGWFRTAWLAGASAILLACSDGLPEPIIEGRSGGELRDEGCDWSLVRSTTSTGVDLRYQGAGGSGATTVWPAGSDDLVWLEATIPCVDARTIVFGGVDEDADSVVMTRSDGERFEPELFEVADRSWQAVFGEVPPQWFADGIFNVEIVVSANGEELGRDTVQAPSG